MSRPRPAPARAAMLAVAAIWLGCVVNPPTPPLRPTGGLDASCLSDYERIQMVGDFTSPAWDIPSSPLMALGPGCVWSLVVRFATPGEHVFKFVTEGAFDNPQDFGWEETQTLRVGVDNAVRLVSGTGTGIKINIPVAGCYLVKLSERDLLFRMDPTSCNTGGVRGVIGFETVTQPPYPRARVQALLGGTDAGSDSSSADDGSYTVSSLAEGTYDVRFRALGYLDTTLVGVRVGTAVVDVDTVRLRAGCLSAFDGIQVAGDFTTPAFDLSVSPAMERVTGCTWRASAQVQAGIHLFKLVTNRNFDSPPDYGGDEGRTLHVDSTYTVRPVTGTGTALKMDFPITGSYDFFLDEEARTLRVTIGDVPSTVLGILVFEGTTRPPLPRASVALARDGAEVQRTESAAIDGAFALRDVAPGRYDVRVVPPVRAPTHLDSTLAGVSVSVETNLGQIFLARARGGVQGSIAFSDVAAAPFPVATVELRRAAAVAATVTTAAASPSYAASGLKPGEYTLRVAASGYVDTTFTVAIGRTTRVLDPVTIQRFVCPAYPAIDVVQLGGRAIAGTADTTFSWNLGRAPAMAQVSFCRWEASVACPSAADYRIKFIVNGDFGGDPPDFGGDNTTLIPPDSTVTVVPTATPGTGEALVIRIQEPGVHRFRLDLGTLTFSFTRTGDLPAAAARAATTRRRGTGSAAPPR